MTKFEKRSRLQHTVKIGIIKQLYKDNKITDVQYRNLLLKYGKKKPEQLVIAVDYRPYIWYNIYITYVGAMVSRLIEQVVTVISSATGH